MKNVEIKTTGKLLSVTGLPDTMTYTEVNEPTNYNGWSNYETWKVNLEIFDGNDWNEEAGSYTDLLDFSEVLKERADEAITGYGEIDENSLAVCYARSFLENVNFYEIAKSIANNYPQVIEGEKSND